MGKATGFLDYDRKENAGQEPLERIKTYREFHTPMEMNERQKTSSTLHGLRRSILPVRKTDRRNGIRMSA